MAINNKSLLVVCVALFYYSSKVIYVMYRSAIYIVMFKENLKLFSFQVMNNYVTGDKVQ